jgi:predicted nucleotidyltransferase
MDTGIGNSDLCMIVKIIFDAGKVDKVVLFGSRATGRFKTASDIDLCLFGEKLSQAELSDLELQLDDLLLPWKIDLVQWESIDNSALKEHIEKFGLDLGSL